MLLLPFLRSTAWRPLLALIVVLTMGRRTAQAQGWTGLATSNYGGTNGLYWNPSSIADSRHRFYVNLAGADVNFYNDYLELATPYTPWQLVRGKVGNEYRDGSGNVVFQREYLRETLNGRSKFATLSAEARLPSFFISLGPKQSIAFSSRVRGFAQAVNVSEPLARLGRYGLGEAQALGLTDQLLTDNSFNVSVNAFHEFALSYALATTDNTDHFFKAGVTVKYLVGLGSGYVNNQGAQYQVYNEDSIQVRDRQITYGTTDYEYYRRDNFKVGDFYGKNRLGRGFGGDIGVTYEWRPKAGTYDYSMDGATITDHTANKYRLKAGLALVDLGGIVYNNPNYVRQTGLTSTGTVQIGSLDTIRYRNVADVDNLMQQLVGVNSKTREFTSVLPAALNVTADYRFRDHLYVGAAWRQNLVQARAIGSRAASSVALIPRLEYSQAEVSFPLMLANNYDKFQVGAMVRLGPLTVGSDNLGGIFGATTITGYDVYASLGFGLDKKKPKDKDKDGVSDALDKCPTTKGTWEFRGCPDRDGDHVQDKDDACPDVPGLVKFKGCPDTDLDGVPDSEDFCPTEPGPVALQGCPDLDGDGVADKDDKCPEDPGLVALQGCPDADGDGITDAEDKCPELAGPAEHQGCPDTDGDGTFDPDDKCPAVAGPADNQGCPYVDTDLDGTFDHLDGCPAVAGPVENKGCPWPDTDADGTPDNKDLCPKTPGPKTNNGCPVLKKAEQKIVATAFANLQFLTGKDVIRTKSYASLNALAKLLQAKPTFRLRLAGHTDNVGKPAANLLLSQKRAEAVKRYLVKRGVPAERIVAEWFGQTKPKASNKTATGRARNRRVEMKVLFE